MFEICRTCLKSDATPIVFIGEYYVSLCQQCRNKFREFELNNKKLQELKKQYEFLNYSIEIEKDHLKQCYTEIGFVRLLDFMTKFYIINAELYYFCKNWVEKTETSNSISE